MMHVTRRLRAHTQALTASNFELSVRRCRRRVLRFTAIGIVLLLLLLSSSHYLEKKWRSADQLAELEQENRALQQELERLKLNMQMEHATRGALSQQLAELSSQADQLRNELVFYKAQRPSKQP
jgi:cell division septum initiation protein DivIVA